jgi:NAD(P)-dependent dehydrogenase (short-subunit alcohol dehydrogenase family)
MRKAEKMRRILVTGANKGIGLAITIAILEREADTTVVLGSRSLERGQAAVASILEVHPDWSSRLMVQELDVCSDQSVLNAAAEVKARSSDEAAPLYGIVNNAGIMMGAGGLRSVLEVNVLGIKRVCDAFLPLLNPSHGRIVNITSASGPNFVADCSPQRQAFFTDKNIKWSSLQAFMEECLGAESGGLTTLGLASDQEYGLSKACANCYTMVLARNNPNLRINACTPGWIETDMTRPMAGSSGKSPAELGMSPPSEGTRSALFLLFGEPEGNGRYYGSDAVRSPLDRYRAPGSPPFLGD